MRELADPRGKGGRGKSRVPWPLVAGALLFTRRPRFDLRGRVAVITGGSRGLGLALARELAREGARLVIGGRDPKTVERAVSELERLGAETLGKVCDVAHREEVAALVEATLACFGALDVLVSHASSERAIEDELSGTLYPTLAVLPYMRARRAGRIVNITSIAKFAALGLSEGLRSELSKEGIVVTTVVPGLRRGSMNTEHAARRIVTALRRGEAEVTLSASVRLLRLGHALAPSLVVGLLGLLKRLLPEARREISEGEPRPGELEDVRSAPASLERPSSVLSPDERVDEASMQSFPASDPPSY